MIRGAVAGAVTVLFSYPVFALLVALSDDSFVSLLPMLVIPPIATGWFTLPIALGVGALLGGVQRWLPAPAPAASEPGH